MVNLYGTRRTLTNNSIVSFCDLTPTLTRAILYRFLFQLRKTRYLVKSFPVSFCVVCNMSLRAVSLPLLLLFAATTRAACYFPDGGLSSLDVPCDDTASESFCCFGGQACLSNKLCYDPTTLRFARGTCTDPNWESAACPKFCLNGTR